MAPARWRSDDTTTGRTAMWTGQDPTRPLFILRLSPFNTQANHSTLAAASPASCRAVGRGGGGHGRSPGRTVGTPAQYSSGLQEPSRSWISNADIPDRGRRQQGFLRGLAGYGPSVFLPDGRGFAVHAVLSSRTDRQGGDSCGMVFLRERRDALQPRAGQAEHVDGCESSSKPVLQNLFKHGPK